MNKHKRIMARADAVVRISDALSVLEDEHYMLTAMARGGYSASAIADATFMRDHALESARAAGAPGDRINMAMGIYA